MRSIKDYFQHNMAAVLACLKKNTIFHQISTNIFAPIKTNCQHSTPLTSNARSLSICAPVCGKYHHVKKKRKLQQERRNKLAARLEKMDPEDRPTGCLLCPKHSDIVIDYKNVRLLSQFVSPHTGRIYSKEATGLCMYKQNEIKKAIRRSRSLGYMPFTMKYFSFHQDPKLF